MKSFYTEKEGLVYFKKEGVIIFPTETVYGLGAAALLPFNINKIYQIKNRPKTNPLIVHFSNIDHVEEYAYMNEMEKNICKILWPGPLTVLLKKKNNLLNATNNNSEKICCRVSNSSFLQSMIKENGPICAPSANLSGLVTITKHQMAVEQYKHLDIGIFVNDSIVGGLESTIIECSNDKIIILREGLISLQFFKQFSKFVEITSQPTQVPGSYFKHYKISKPIKIDDSDDVGFFITCGDKTGDFNLSQDINDEEITKNFFYSFFLGDMSKQPYVILDKNIIHQLNNALKNRLNKMLE